MRAMGWRAFRGARNGTGSCSSVGVERYEEQYGVWAVSMGNGGQYERGWIMGQYGQYGMASSDLELEQAMVPVCLPTRCPAQYRMVWYGMVWYGMIRSGVVAGAGRARGPRQAQHAWADRSATDCYVR